MCVFLCVFVSVYVHISVFVSVYVHISVCVCMCNYVCVHVHLRLCAHTFVDTCTPVCTHIHVHMFVNVNVFTVSRPIITSTWENQHIACLCKHIVPRCDGEPGCVRDWTNNSREHYHCLTHRSGYYIGLIPRLFWEWISLVLIVVHLQDSSVGSVPSLVLECLGTRLVPECLGTRLVLECLGTKLVQSSSKVINSMSEWLTKMSEWLWCVHIKLFPH